MSVPYTDSEASEAWQWSNRYGPPNAWTASLGTAARMIGRLLDERERLMAKQTGAEYRAWVAQNAAIVKASKKGLREHLAAAALAGRFTDFAAFEIADAMLRERERTNHDAAPVATARTDADSDRTDKAAPRPSEGTGDTPATHATQGEGSEQREGTEPVAWAVACDYGDYGVALFSDEASAQTEADRRALVNLRSAYVVVPLYRHPPCQDLSRKNLTLTDAEREAIYRASQYLSQNDVFEGMAEDAATLRGLLERLG